MTSHVRLSAFIHALLILVALTLPLSKGDGTEDGESQTGGSRTEEPLDVTIVDPPSEEAVVVEDEGLAALKKIAPHAGETCERFYGGIGIQDSFEGVIDVYPGYPAHRAGIQVGDTIVGSGNIRGDVGTPVTVVVLRGLRRITFELIRDKICVL